MQELFKEMDPRAPVPLDVQTLRKELEALYTIPTANIDYSIGEVRLWAQNQALIQAINESVDLLQGGKVKEIRSRIDAALEVGEDKKAWADEAFYCTEPVLPPEVLPGVLEVGGIGLVLGTSKTAKTWNLLAAAIAVGLGKSWMGFGTCVPKRVLYVNMELTEQQLKKRLDLLCSALGTSRADLKGRVDFLNLKGCSNTIENVLGQINIGAARWGNPWRLVIIDPIYKLYASNEKENVENSNAAIAAFFEKLEALAAKLYAAILAAHHFKKGNNAQTLTIDLGSGAGTFARSPDALIALRPLEEEDSWRCETILRYFPPKEPFGLRWQFPLLVPDTTLDLEEVAGRPGPSKQYRVEEILSQLAEEGMGNKEWFEALEDKLDVSKTTYNERRKEALERKFIYADGPTSKHATRYFLTEEGKEAVERYRKAGKLNEILARNRKSTPKGYSRIGGNGHK